MKTILKIISTIILFFPFAEKLCAQAQITDADLPYSYNREDAAFSQVSLSKIIAEKMYPDNTKIGYFEINNLLSDTENAVIEQELIKNQKILRFQTFPSQTGIQYMFEADRSFSADSVVFYMNNVLVNLKRGAYDNIPIKASGTILPPPVAFDMPDACFDAAPFCTDNQYQFPAAVNVADLGAFGCLFRTPNPAWYWMQIDDPGDLEITITSNFDVDFIAWGPFIDLNDACHNASPTCPVNCPDNTDWGANYPYGNIADCSFHPRAFEICHIANAQHGEIYLLLITNYSNRVTDIEFHQTGGDASTNCGIIAPPVTNNGPLCEGDSLLLTVISPVAGATYSWTGPNGWTSAQENPVIYNVTTADAGIYTLIITLNGEVGNPEMTDVVISTNPVAAISPDSSTLTCSRQSVTLTASGGVTYSWSDGSSVVGNSAELIVADAGTYTVTVTNEGGCSDTAIITVNIDTTSYMFVEIDTICASLTPYIWHNNQYNITGVYYDSLIAVNGCDSTVMLELTVLPVYDTLVTDTICFGDTYTNPTYAFLDTTPTAPGLIAWDTTLYTIIGGCDSIVRLELTVLPVYDTLIIDTICFGDTYTNPTYAFLDTMPTAPGLIAWDTTLYTIIGGCDSIVRLELTVLPVYNTLITDTICFGDTYINQVYAFLDTTPTAPGLIAWDTTLYTVIGNCDSTVRLELTVLPVYDTLITDTICFGDTYTNPTYAFLDTTPTAPGLIAWDTTLYTVIGSCDSTVRLELTVLPVYDTLVTDTICLGDTYINPTYAFLDTTPTTPGLIAWDTTLYTVIGNCDSTVRLELTVLPVYDTLITDTICFGDTYTNPTYAFLDTTPTAPGLIAWDTTLYMVIGNCDSTVRLELTVLHVYDTLITDTICFGDTYINTNYAFLDTTPTMPGLIAWDTTLYTIIGGCDSIVRLELTVLPVYNTLVTDTICFGDTYINPVYAFLDTTPTATGLIALDTTLYTIIGGCDSTVRLELTVLPVYDTLVIDTICFGDTYINPAYAFLDTTPTMPGLIAWDTTLYTIIGGCDSTVRLELTVLPVYDTLVIDTICFGDAYINPVYAFLDTTPTAPGLIAWDTTLYTIIGGCDSTVRLELTVLPVYDRTVTASICLGDTYKDDDFDLTPAAPGLVKDSTELVTVIGGCDSIIRLELTVLATYDTLITDTICLGKPYDKYGFNEEPVQVGLMQYSKNLTGTNGCDSMVNLNLMVNPTYDIIINASVCEGDSYDANGFNISVSQPGFYTYTHSLKTTDCDCDSIVTLQLAVNPVYDEYVFARIYEDEFYRVGNYQYNTPGLHVSNLKTEEGCDSIVTLNLDVIYYPFITAFSPFNKDGINDYFMSGFRVQIFNRYGTPVYETRTQEEQDMGWDGKNSRGQNVEPGLYFYILYNSSGKPRLKSSVEVLKR